MKQKGIKRNNKGLMNSGDIKFRVHVNNIHAKVQLF